ncbi:MAG: Nif3-like dinuclear metal center hexameric protein [Desulfobacterales bacterium]|jgi:dinuclear metal center YbgI/SA1388 family protein|nr:Nif3-like dinuclear metal center hexameric protein [Desulfobacterales bacterium]
MAVAFSVIARILERIAPAAMAEAWDNVGLQVGDPGAKVARIWVALDAGPEVVRAAGDAGIDLIITHHPLIFRALKQIDLGTPTGAAIGHALRHQLAVVSLHTNLDSAPGGLNDLLGRRLGLRRMRPLSRAPAAAAGTGPGIGRVGDLPRPQRLEALALRVKRRLDAPLVRLAGDPRTLVRSVAVATGSGGSLVPDFLRSGAQVFISGDLGYHDARAVEYAGRCLIDVGHFHSERLMKEALVERLRAEFARRRMAVRVQACPLEADPFTPV